MTRGFRNAEIASFLHLSRHTVRNHLVAVFRKAEVSTRAELVFAITAPDAVRAPAPGRRRASAARAPHAWEAYLSEPLAR